ncbi:DUF4825 domain-containing protein [Bacillus sp. BRMEA1]|uniref:DUF4825 domain-containing protein n=1 Tax=Neobacillus endophyticus TaxID=2738405 RepID=UPI0015670B77|nr:DUF4825 domain-containing protein [Neobacillus endophyticus]NRD77824.1 DUF4825 domain-containing protein [Neobacillus endophyticus]
MKSRISAFLSLFFIAIFVLSGCSIPLKKNENKSGSAAENKDYSIYNDYYNNKVQYIGNNSEVINLLHILKAGDLGEYTIELTTDKEPFGLTINYSKLRKNDDEDKFKTIRQIEFSFYLLALIDNLSFVDVNYKTYHDHLDIEEANKTVNGKIKNFGSSPEKLKELNDILHQK